MSAPLHGPHLELNERERETLWRYGLRVIKAGFLLVSLLLVGLVSWLFLPLAVVALAVALGRTRLYRWFKRS